MERLPLIDPAKQPKLAFQALLDGFTRLCSHEPMLRGHTGLVADTEPSYGCLQPAPAAVTLASGFIGLTAKDDFAVASQRGWKICAGDTVVVDLRGVHDVGDTVLFAHVELRKARAAQRRGSHDPF